MYVGEKKFIKFKKNVFVLKLNSDWLIEPILVPDTKYFEHNSSIVKKLINSRFLVERLDCDFTNEKEEFNFIVGLDDLERFLPKEEPIVEDVALIENHVSNKSSDKTNIQINDDLTEDTHNSEENEDDTSEKSISSDKSEKSTKSTKSVKTKKDNVKSSVKTKTKSKTLSKSPIKAIVKKTAKTKSPTKEKYQNTQLKN